MQSYEIVKWGKPLQLRIRETPVPQGEEVLVKIEESGVCHSDVHIGKGYFDLGGGRRVNIADTGASLPLTMGHEMAGTVVALGPQATGIEIGTRVYFSMKWLSSSLNQKHATPDETASAPTDYDCSNDSRYGQLFG